jgi:hypothetical protein
MQFHGVEPHLQPIGPGVLRHAVPGRKQRQRSPVPRRRYLPLQLSPIREPLLAL